jgi:hypothetical protein
LNCPPPSKKTFQMVIQIVTRSSPQGWVSYYGEPIGSQRSFPPDDRILSWPGSLKNRKKRIYVGNGEIDAR